MYRLLHRPLSNTDNILDCLKLQLNQANSAPPPLILTLHYQYPIAFHILHFLHAELRPPFLHN